MLKLLLYITTFLASAISSGQTFSGTGGPLADTANSCFSLTVNGVGTMNGSYGLATVCIDIHHPFTGDLEIILKSPDGTQVPLSLQNGGTGSDYHGTCFTATATIHIANGVAPFTGFLGPQGYLGSVNNGQSADGNWSLCIRDLIPGGSGLLNSWSVQFNNQPAPPLPVCFNTQSAGVDCQSALPVCNFNGFCGNTSSNIYASHSWGNLNGIFCSSINNNSFISFIAGSTTETFKVYVTKSRMGGGLQVLFFSGPCDAGPLQSHGCYSRISPGSNYNLVSATGLAPGKTYFMMMDGYAGDECEYTITGASATNSLQATPSSPVICSGDSVSIIANGGTGLYTWSPAAGLNQTSGASVIATPPVTTTYTVTDNTASVCVLAAQVTVTVNPVSFLGNDTVIAICPGSTANLNLVYSTAGLHTSWSMGNSSVADPSAVSLPGVYRLVTGNATGCADTAFVTVTIVATPSLGADQTLTIAPNNIVDLTAIFNTAGLVTNWSIGGAVVASPVAVTVAGIYQLIAINQNGCADTALVHLVAATIPALGPDLSVQTCFGTTVNLAGLFNTAGLVTQWTASGNPVNNPAAAGAGLYQLIVFNSAGYSDTALVNIMMSNRLNIGIDQQLTICQGNRINLGTLYNVAGLSTSWTLSGSPVIDPSLVGTAGVYRLIASNGTTCADTAFVTLAINSKPDLGADQSTGLCSGSKIQLMNRYATNGLVSAWSFNGSPVNPIAPVGAAGNYQLIAHTPAGCADTALVRLNVYPDPTMVVHYPAPICTPATANLTAAAITAGSDTGLLYSYWANAAASIPLANPATMPAGIFYIRGTDANGCFVIQPITVTVYPVPVAIAGSDTTICTGGVAHLLARVTHAARPASYVWKTATNTMAGNGNDLPVSPAGTILYVLTATVNYGSCRLTATDSMTVFVRPPLTVSAGRDVDGLQGLPLYLHASGGYQYKWSPAGVLNDATSADPIANVQQDTRFILQAISLEGCSAYDTVLVRLFKAPGYFLPNAFTPNGDGLNDRFRPVAVGIANTNWFRIFNRQGQQVFESDGQADGWDGFSKGKKQPPGNYVWMISGIDINGKMISRKGNVLLLK